MSEYARIRTLIEHSANSDYGSASTHSVQDTDTPNQAIIKQRMLVQTGGTTVDLAMFTDSTMDYLMVKNTDSTNFVKVEWVSAEYTTANDVKLAAGQYLVVPDVQLAGDLTLTADTADLDVELSMFAS